MLAVLAAAVNLEAFAGQESGPLGGKRFPDFAAMWLAGV
jgi:hypothetical protein